MSINDIRTELDSLKNETTDNHNSDKTINDILNNNIKIMEDYVNGRVINIYARPGISLKQNSRKKKLIDFFDNELNQSNIDENNSVKF